MARRFCLSNSVCFVCSKQRNESYSLLSGLHNCAGKGLAFLTLRTVVSAIVQNFDIGFVPGETMEDFDEKFLDTFMIALPQLKLCFTPRAKA